MFDIDVEVLWIARYDHQPEWFLEEHEHNCYQIIYAIDGYGKFIMNDGLWDISKEILFFIKPGIRHGLFTDKKGILKTLDIKFYINDEEIIHKLKYTNGVFPQCQHEIYLLLERIRNESLNKDLYYEEFSRIYLRQILLLLIRQMDRAKFNKHREPNETYDIFMSPPVYN